MRKKGFTLVELLVVIAIIALLMGILMPALARVRQLAYRMVCGTNLSGIGKAMLLYANDNKEEFPVAGCSKSTWAPNGQIYNWTGTSTSGGTPTQAEIFRGDKTTQTGGTATIGASFWLLVKYADVTPKQFTCKGDVGVKVFKASDYPSPTVEDLTLAWDFGRKPGRYNSYSYHLPYESTSGPSPNQAFPVSFNNDAATPLCADRNPFLDINADYLEMSTQGPAVLSAEEIALGSKTPCEYWTTVSPPEYRDPEKTLNAAAHQRDGQNVLFVDGSVNFQRTANVGVDKDNIWGYWQTASPKPGKQYREACCQFPGHNKTGTVPTFSAPTTTGVAAPDDAYLVNEPQNTGV